MQIRRITLNGRVSGLANPGTAAKMLHEIETAAKGRPAWVTIPIRETNQPQALITGTVDCFIEILDVPDEDPEVLGAAIAFGVYWPEVS